MPKTCTKSYNSLFPPSNNLVNQCKSEILLIIPCFHKKLFQKIVTSIQGAFFETGSMLPKFKSNIFSLGEIFSIREQWISISGAGSQNENQFFLNRSRFLISGAHNFNFGSMLPKMKHFFQFRKEISISGAGLTNSGA